MKRTNTAAPASTTSGWAWYAVGVLLFAYVFSIMDRQILTLLVGPIQKSLGVNDTLMGVLHGFTFAAFYAIMGLPIARMIDRGNRPVTIAVWSVATAASGLATAYWHLVAARTGVAIGEAVLIPGAVSREHQKPWEMLRRRNRLYADLMRGSRMMLPISYLPSPPRPPDLPRFLLLSLISAVPIEPAIWYGTDHNLIAVRYFVSPGHFPSTSSVRRIMPHGRDRHCGSSLKSTAVGPAITSTMPAKRADRPAL